MRLRGWGGQPIGEQLTRAARLSALLLATQQGPRAQARWLTVDCCAATLGAALGLGAVLLAVFDGGVLDAYDRGEVEGAAAAALDAPSTLPSLTQAERVRLQRRREGRMARAVNASKARGRGEGSGAWRGRRVGEPAI